MAAKDRHGSGAERPAAAPDTASLQLFRLEALLMALQELTGLSRSQAVGELLLQRYTGAEALGATSTPEGLCRSLEHASRLCNTALAALTGVSTDIAREIARLRDLIVALADLVEADLYRTEYPLEREHAFRELTILLGLSRPGSRRELLHACFGVGARIATRAIDALQAERRRHTAG